MQASYGEANLNDNLANKKIYPFKYLGDMPGMAAGGHGCGEITVPADFENKYREEDGIHVHIPYIAEYRPLAVRFRQEHSSGSVSYMINRSDNTVWFPVKGSGGKPVFLSSFRAVNPQGDFNLILREGTLLLYSGHETDFTVKPSLEQTKVFLLKASTGNCYQYPLTGVGLINFLHGNLENSNLPSKLLEEFQADGMTVKNAYMDSASGDLILEVEEKE